MYPCSALQHTSAVTALDVVVGAGKPLLATGSAHSEIYVWDMNRPGTAMVAGPVTGPDDVVAGLAWNLHAPHMLAATGPIKETQLWDLRVGKPTFGCKDGSGRMQCSAVRWNDASGGVQVFVSSDSPTFAAVQLWDFRMPGKPVSEVIAHENGACHALRTRLYVCVCVVCA